MSKRKAIACTALLVAGTMVHKYYKDKKEAIADLRRRVDVLERDRNKLDSYQKVYVSLLRQYSEMDGRDYVSYIAENIKSRGWSTIIVYGCGPVGKLFADVLPQETVKIQAFIDKAPRENEYKGIPVYSIKNSDNLKRCDCIIVTPVYMFRNILDDLYAAGRNEEIIRITDIIQTV